jgi:O-antigen/teichoic acid export membrane protein
MLGFLTLPVFVGYYSSSLKIVWISLTMVMATEKVMVPQLAAAYHNNNWEAVNRLVNKSINFVCLIGCPAMCLIIALSPQIIGLLTGPRFLPAIVSTRILAPTVLLIGLNSIFGLQILTTMGREKYFMRSVIIGMLFSVISNLILIPTLKHVGTSVTNFFTELLVLALTYFYAVKYTEVKIKLIPLLKYVLTAGFSVIVSIALLLFINISSNVYIILFVSVLSGSIYFVLLYLFKEEITRNMFTTLITNKFLSKLSKK